jgi:pimeloyl-ACP methyl ester carboxylesterase
MGLISDERLEREKRSRGSIDYRTATGIMRDILVKVVNESYESQLSRITHPVHLLWGENDREVPVSVAESASALLSDSTLEVLAGVGHLVPIQAPEALRVAVERALT